MPNSHNHSHKTQTQGIAGWYLPKSSTDNAYLELEAMLTSLNSTLSGDTQISPTYACAATTSLCALSDNNDQSIAAIIGKPVWKTEELRQYAREVGASAALAAAYQKDDVRFLEQISGSFAFVIIDAIKDTLLLGVDHLARLPLYYTRQNNGLIFGSSARTVLAHSCSKAKISEQGLYDYLYFHMSPSPNTVYKNIEKLAPAHYLKITHGKIDVQPYFQPHFDEIPQRRFSSMAKELRSQLKAAVERSITHNDSTGVLLDHSIDSASVTGMLAEFSEHPTRAYAVIFEGEIDDDIALARTTAKQFGVTLNEYTVTPDDLLEALPDIASSYDEPFGSTSALRTYFCARLAADDGITHLLSGDGGNEIFAGNQRYKQQSKFDRYQKIPLSLRTHFIDPLGNALPDQTPFARIKNYIAQANRPLPDRLQTFNFMNRHAVNGIFSSDFIAAIDTSAPTRLQQQVYQQLEGASTLNRLLYFDWRFHLADDTLKTARPACALAGVDINFPLLDDELIAFAGTIPSRWKMKSKHLHYFYKKALKGWLPDATLKYKQRNPSTNFNRWMTDHKPLQELTYDNLLKLKQRNFLNPVFIDQLIERHRAGNAEQYNDFIWLLSTLQLWLDQNPEAL